VTSESRVVLVAGAGAGLGGDARNEDEVVALFERIEGEIG
jgi:hypothetical protein